MYLADDMEYNYGNLKITRENLFKHTVSNIDLLEGKPVAIVIEFHGLGNERGIRPALSEPEKSLAKHNVLTLYPYYGYWSWMNDNSAGYIDMR